MKYYRYTITIDSEDLITSELIEEFLGEAFEPSGYGNKLRGVVTHISRKEIKPEEYVNGKK